MLTQTTHETDDLQTVIISVLKYNNTNMLS